MKKLTRRRGRFTSQERAALIGRYRISDLTQKQFAEENQIRLGTFQQWLMRERRKTSLNGSGNGFREVPLPAILSHERWAAELVVGPGLSLRLSHSAPVDWVCSLVNGLNARCSD
jgi:hypothetical protein